MNIPFFNMQREAEFLVKNGLMQELESVILSGKYLFGPKSEELENRFSEMFNSEAVLVGSGTDAIYLSLLANGIGPNDTVIVPAYSAIPTAVAVKMTGAKIKYIDVNSSGYLSEIEKCSAVVVVHLYGNSSCNIFDLLDFCRAENITLIEDCAQSFGAKYKDNMLGTIGNCGAFSFYPSKTLGCFGDSGMVITSNGSVAEKIKELRFYGQKNKQSMGNLIGMNSRIDELQSMILLKKLDIISTLMEKRFAIFEQFKDNFSQYTIKWLDGCVPHLFPIIVKNRKLFIKKMRDRGVETAIHYPFTLPAIIDNGKEKYPNAERLASGVVSLPFHPWLTDVEVNYIINVTKMCLLEMEVK